jgi:hypothetical protein
MESWVVNKTKNEQIFAAIDVVTNNNTIDEATKRVICNALRQTAAVRDVSIENLRGVHCLKIDDNMVIGVLDEDAVTKKSNMMCFNSVGLNPPLVIMMVLYRGFMCKAFDKSSSCKWDYLLNNAYDKYKCCSMGYQNGIYDHDKTAIRLVKVFPFQCKPGYVRMCASCIAYFPENIPFSLQDGTLIFCEANTLS